MIDSDFGEGWVGSPIERWAALLMKSGVLFWLGGLAAWAWNNDLHLTFDITCWLTKDYKAVPTLLSIFGLLVMVAIAGSLLKRFDLITLRFLEGYYRLPRIRQWRINNLEKWIQEEVKRFNYLAEKGKNRDAIEEREFIRLDWMLMYLPDQGERLPTRLGNLLRAIESRPFRRYGLEAFVCFPRLWLVLPDHVKREIAQARDNLDSTVRIWNWGLLFMIWTIWAWWAVPISLMTMYLSYHWILHAARIYGQLVESAFDLYRHLLYKELRFPFPENPLEERKQGILLTEFLWRGAGDKTPMFESYRMD